MGFYARHILPHVIDLAMRNKEMTRLRAAWIPYARCGVGNRHRFRSDLPFYSAQVQHVYGVDPSQLQRMARNRAAGRVDVEFVSQSAEAPLPLPHTSIDTVVITWTLCSIPDPDKALQEMRRVLKPGGRLVFIEHGRSSDPGIVAWQDRLTPLWKRIAGGCHLNRKVDALITAAGFQITKLKTFYLPGPHPMTYTYQALAQAA